MYPYRPANVVFLSRSPAQQSFSNKATLFAKKMWPQDVALVKGRSKYIDNCGRKDYGLFREGGLC